MTSTLWNLGTIGMDPDISRSTYYLYPHWRNNSRRDSLEDRSY